MSRNLDPSLSAAVTAPQMIPAFLASIAFKSGTQYVWSGPGPLTYDGQTYTGVGSLAGIGSIVEGLDITASGTSLSLSGIDTTWLNECLTDIQSGAPASTWFGALGANGFITGPPYLLFQGTVDKPTVSIGADTSTITLALENRLVDLQRATSRRYTAADQHVAYPDDIGLNWVEILSDISEIWGA